MKTWKNFSILCLIFSMGITPLTYSNDDILPWEEDNIDESIATNDSSEVENVELTSANPSISDNSFPELNYENMNIQAANQNAVESKRLPDSKTNGTKPSLTSVTKEKNQSQKIAVSYNGEQKVKDIVSNTSENYHIDESQLISGSAPLFQ